jgi:GxxExxY protein
MVELLFKEEVYTIVGAAMQVYNTLGPGFLEAVYQESLGIEFDKQNIPYTPQCEIPVYYGDQRLKTCYKADFLVYDKIIIEIKALQLLSTREEAQLINYLKATGLNLGLLINFGSKEKLEWQRRVLTNKRSVQQNKKT